MPRLLTRCALAVMLSLGVGGCAIAPTAPSSQNGSTSTARTSAVSVAAPWIHSMARLPLRHMRPAASGSTYGSDSATNEVWAFSHARSPQGTPGVAMSCPSTCTLCKAPGSGWDEVQGIGIDGHGNVYVADTLNSRIVELDPGCQSVMRILYDPFEYPVGVAVARNGLIGVTNICSAPSCGPGNIVFYAPGSSYVRYAATGLLSRYYYGAFDRRGNFYNDGFTASSTVTVGIVRTGSTIDTAAGISGIQFPGGVEVARNGTVNIDDQYCLCIQIYKNTHNVGTVTLGGTEDPVTFALAKNNKSLWVADADTGTFDEYSYPNGGEPFDVLGGFTEPIGVGVAPASPP